MTTKRVLPADVYDALELVAEVFGGIGAAKFGEKPHASMDIRRGDVAPYCVWGMERWLDGIEGTAVDAALIHADLYEIDNDRAVYAINARNGTESIGARVPFADWCKELGVERGA